MSEEVNLAKLAVLLRRKRDGRGLRTVAKEIGDISASTLSRVEQGKVPDLDTYVKLCRWLGVPPERLMRNAVSEADADEDTLTGADRIAVHLRADRVLDPRTADALTTMIRLAYAAASRGEISGPIEE